MDHRWDAAVTRQHELRGERERYGNGGGVLGEDDPEVLRRDQLHEEARRRMRNLSPWEIGRVFYDQRDLYTRNGEIDERGYALGPRNHPNEGSYAYARSLSSTIKKNSKTADNDTDNDNDNDTTTNSNEPTLQEREAWPWLNYHDMAHDPFFAGRANANANAGANVWERLKNDALNLRDRIARALNIRSERHEASVRSDARIIEDIEQAMSIHVDLDATDIDVTAKEGIVLLEGTVPNRRSKQLAEEVSFGIRGVRDVQNRLVIHPSDPNDTNVAFVLGLGGLLCV